MQRPGKTEDKMNSYEEQEKKCKIGQFFPVLDMIDSFWLNTTDLWIERKTLTIQTT